MTDAAPMVRFDNVTKRYGALTVLDDLDLDIAPRREGRDHRPVGLRQDHGAAHADDARDDQRRGHLGRGRAADPHGAERPARAGRRRPTSAGCAAKIGMVFQSLQSLPAHDRAAELHRGAGDRARLSKDGGDRARRRASRHGRSRRQEGPLSRRSSRAASSSGWRSPARCAMRPKVMLFDEVTSALDPELVGEVLNVIRQPRRGARPDHADGHPPDGLRQGVLRPGLLLLSAARSASRGRRPSSSAARRTSAPGSS